MKRLLCILLILIISSQIIQGQVIEQADNNSQQELYDFHMLKHKKNKTAAWILGGSGVTMTLVGLVINGAETAVIEVFTLGTGGVEKERKGDWLIYAGGATTLASIPFIISAGKNKRKASMSLQTGHIKFNNKTYSKNCMNLTLTIPF